MDARMTKALYDSFIADYYDESPIVQMRKSYVAFYLDAVDREMKGQRKFSVDNIQCVLRFTNRTSEPPPEYPKHVLGARTISQGVRTLF